MGKDFLVDQGMHCFLRSTLIMEPNNCGIVR